MFTFQQSADEIERLIMDDSFTNQIAETLEFHLSMCELFVTHTDPLAGNKLIFLRHAVGLYRSIVYETFRAPGPVVPAPVRPPRRRPNVPRAPLRELTNERLTDGIASRKTKRAANDDGEVVEVRKRLCVLAL